MVTQYGMSEKVGLAIFEEPHAPYLQSPLQERGRRPFSETTAEEIDSEVKAILEQGARPPKNHLKRTVPSSRRARSACGSRGVGRGRVSWHFGRKRAGQ